MSTFFTKKGNTAVPISTVLSDANGPVDLSTALSVKFLMRPVEGRNFGPRKVDADATPDSDQTANKGSVMYEWQDVDLNQPGLYVCEWEVTLADNSVVIFP